MSENTSAAEWLRGIIEEYEASGSMRCSAMAKMFGIVCEHERTCRDCITKMMTDIADRIDAERALPEGVEWPRFEDGGLVKIGDEVEAEDEDEVGKVAYIEFEAREWIAGLHVGEYDVTHIKGEYGERVKRPTPKVLDADGAPIEVGDTVWCGEDQLLVVCSTVGAAGDVRTTVKDDEGMHYTLKPSCLSRKRPDSWERLEEDAYHLVMSEYLETPEKDVSDLVRRAKALAKAGE